MLRFAEVERSSFHDLLAAANATADPARAAKYLRHATDERRHADAFAARALALDPSLAGHPALSRADFEQLYARLGERRFAAFVHHGERRGRAQMAMFRDELASLGGTARADDETLALLDRVIADEVHHERYTGALVTELGASVAGAVLWELGRDWRRLGGVTASALFFAGTAALYLALGPLALVERSRR
jgi:hypothetical protein